MRFLALVFTCVVMTVTSTYDSDDIWSNYVALLRTVNLTDHSTPLEQHGHTSERNVDVTFDCNVTESPEIPTSVHKLRPGDIKVIAAMGDSLTAGNAAGARNLLEIAIQYRGLSAPIGGDEELAEVVTLPNILRQYNPGLYGYSIGKGFYPPIYKTRLNVAKPGAFSEEMAYPQSVRLVDLMRKDPKVDFDEDWKLVTLLIGANDLCQQCHDPVGLSPEHYVLQIEEALMTLMRVPRMFVNVIGVINVYIVSDLTKGVCDFIHKSYCSCGIDEKEDMIEITKQYQSLLQASIESGKFDTRDDFTVVFQPFFLNTTLPLNPNGTPDYSYFSPDCFHFSVKGQGTQAIATWNNMIQPVGSKDTKWEEGAGINCPSKDFPYFYTNKNSMPSWRDSNGESKHGDKTPQQDPTAGPNEPYDASDEGEISTCFIALTSLTCAVLTLTGVLVFLALKMKQKQKKLNQMLL